MVFFLGVPCRLRSFAVQGWARGFEEPPVSINVLVGRIGASMCLSNVCICGSSEWASVMV